MNTARPPDTLRTLAAALAAGCLLAAAGCDAGDVDRSGEAGSSSRPPAAGTGSEAGDRGSGARSDRVPDVSVRRLDGEEVSLREAVDRPTVLNFWATWCGPCRREMPELGELHRAVAPRGQVIGISLDSGAAEPIRRFAEEHGAGYSQFRASEGWARRHFQVRGIPTTLVVDGSGRVHARLVGPQTKESIMESLRPLLEAPSLRESRDRGPGAHRHPDVGTSRP